MREILFRGKRTLNGEWIYGNYCGAEYLVNDGIEHLIIEVPRSGASGKVIPETIGQYTGLTDKNGKKIFEGDIVKHYNNSDDGFDIGALYWDETFLQWKRTSVGNFHHSSFTYMMSRSCEYEVIGNIHDNPELLKEGAE